MCVRTKTSWGCGHEFKTTNECHSSRCQGLERYHYEKGRDCRDCKEGGHAITRGREGKGRYAQELSRRNSAESSNESLDVGSGISPWANPNKREKEWHSPSRKKADDAWLQEHVDRYSDLQTIRDSISGSDRASTTVYSPIRRNEKVYEYEEDQQHDRISSDYEYRRRPSTTSRAMKIELRITARLIIDADTIAKRALEAPTAVQSTSIVDTSQLQPRIRPTIIMNLMTPDMGLTVREPHLATVMVTQSRLRRPSRTAIPPNHVL
ncbi:hypothetical protein LTR10_013454 [Elasticomyces elasticus]|uniref:Uncharacterized protein n=1 Tax=Exophiala sideris TaxID=1016849 RepID=A0ABR0JRL3_9EURO|nr:hypothetical protein LTR10_013454 [Elasticomyces elasticus]KAK5039589.1 hypothetical protein LTS07_000083 [Exophiala sideris]KAK5041141.1 hypothetical protein LTR13_002615 [Exophiala sideris]KAK5067966.1 hypothetical protein LTR69_000083 [Exophiala sideris]KAK5187268.1 hypothetical protein LTR44_000083 [Eurotiomycetes sp. CCFEE 6388]